MLPILITVLIIAAVLAVVYLIGSQPSKAEKAKTAKRARTTAGKAAARAAGPKPSPFRQPPPWVRKLPLILVVAAVACLVIALAQFKVARAQKTPVIALVLDASKSMDATDVTPNRLVAAQNAAQGFVSQLPEDFEVALVSFADRPTLLIAPTDERTQVSTALGELPRGEGTVIGDGLSTGLDAIEAQWQRNGTGPAAIVLLSDGHDTGSEVPPQEAADRAAALQIPVYTVVLGAEGNHGANEGLLQEIATATGGGTSTAATAGELSGVYDDLASQLSSQLQISNSAQLFVFLAIALAMAAAVLLLVLTMSKRS